MAVTHKDDLVPILRSVPPRHGRAPHVQFASGPQAVDVARQFAVMISLDDEVQLRRAARIERSCREWLLARSVRRDQWGLKRSESRNEKLLTV